MATLHDLLGKPPHRERVIADTVRLIDSEMARKTGLRAMALRGGYKLVKGIRPGFVRSAVDFLLDDFCSSLDPYYQQWAEAPAESRGTLLSTLSKQESQVADALLSVTDRRAERSKHRTLKKMYQKLRNIAKGHVIEAIPGLSRTVEPYLKADA